ncbi:Peptidylprolyl isomerase [Mycena indigotica]|uniref:Peptidylprolyl isomerase n=1 Tax=Mycena indigotica TaxID=2126181 RepID=A0A8H6T5G8_9AGAR|nr:Peptidylprolyl isomerase [Mycena indigotica]KAF7310317.1 Peptidylprolyl isomerase [Mycena indigotica]
MSIEPRLPIDLERHIFMLAAAADPLSTYTLMQVAWRVKEWVEPVLYRSVIIDAPDCSSPPALLTISRHDVPQFLTSDGHHLEATQNLLLCPVRLSGIEIMNVLRACTNVQDLTITSEFFINGALDLLQPGQLRRFRGGVVDPVRVVPSPVAGAAPLPANPPVSIVLRREKLPVDRHSPLACPHTSRN